MLHQVHLKWIQIIRNFLAHEDLLHLFWDILPEISYSPKEEDIFRIFNKDPTQIRVVILGQDPYPTKDVAIGRAFAVSENSRIPVSLQFIQKELIKEDLYATKDEFSSEWKTLDHWDRQGVFLLNTALTVETGKPGSHLDYWQDFTKYVISVLSVHYNKEGIPLIWLLWGKKAMEYQKYIVNSLNIDNFYEEIPTNRNYILKAPHPASAAYGNKVSFLGCNHFKNTNELLRLNYKQTINW
jgi:uracil-DNA glycosylase